MQCSLTPCNTRRFLANIRECDSIVQVRHEWHVDCSIFAVMMHDLDPLAPFAVAQVVRCFEDDDVIHVAGKVDPVADIDVINFELALADIGQLEKRQERLVKGRVKSREEEASQQVCLSVVVSVALHGGLCARLGHGPCALL